MRIIQVSSYWLLAPGCWLLAADCWQTHRLPSIGTPHRSLSCRMPEPGDQMLGLFTVKIDGLLDSPLAYRAKNINGMKIIHHAVDPWPVNPALQIASSFIYP